MFLIKSYYRYKTPLIEVIVVQASFNLLVVPEIAVVMAVIKIFDCMFVIILLLLSLEMFFITAHIP